MKQPENPPWIQIILNELNQEKKKPKKISPSLDKTHAKEILNT
jgi:hypothetical protein